MRQFIGEETFRPFHKHTRALTHAQVHTVSCSLCVHTPRTIKSQIMAADFPLCIRACACTPLLTYFKALRTYCGICFPASSLFHHDLSSFTLIWLLVAWWASKAEGEIVEASKATLSELLAGWEGGRLSQSLSCREANLVMSDMMTGVPRLHGRWTGLGEQVEPFDGGKWPSDVKHLVLLAEPWDPKTEDGWLSYSCRGLVCQLCSHILYSV